MKRKIVLSVLIVLIIAIAFIINFSTKPNSEQDIDNSGDIENQETDNQAKEQEGYEIIVSKKDITIEKGAETSFDITFTNPDESSIREYITCKDQSDIIVVKYGMLKDKKITVEVEGLKVGTTEISVCDYNYPDRKEIVKVNVIEANNNSENKITEDMAYKGVNNYCHSEYDWSIAEDNPEIMYVTMGDESETEYKVIFRSYTSSFMYFYVDKSTGTTRIVEQVPGLEIEEEKGTINLYDYLK